MKRGQVALAGAAVVIAVLVLIGVGRVQEGEVRVDAPEAPVLSVALTRAEVSTLPIRVPATGNIAAWQEASVGAEADGLRLTDVKVNVGDAVKRGQTLAVFVADIVEAELAEARAAVVQADAEAVEAEVNARRARNLGTAGVMSAQEADRYAAAAKTTRARLQAARAIAEKNRVRLAHTRVTAPSDGIITSRTATVGAVVPAGEELFRLIKDGRLEWRAVVSVADLDRLAPGQSATLDLQGHGPLRGELRMVAPAIDTATHSGLIYVDLPAESVIRAGAFVKGHIEVGDGPALTLPQSAVLSRDGFHYVMNVGPKSRIVTRKVAIGRRIGDRIEIIQGLSPEEAVVASGLGFLSEGDVVRVVDEPQIPASDKPHAVAGAERGS